jgi:hypothetical protein
VEQGGKETACQLSARGRAALAVDVYSSYECVPFDHGKASGLHQGTPLLGDVVIVEDGRDGDGKEAHILQSNHGTQFWARLAVYVQVAHSLNFELRGIGPGLTASPLHIAASGNQPLCCLPLIEAGCSVWARDKFRQTPLHTLVQPLVALAKIREYLVPEERVQAQIVPPVPRAPLEQTEAGLGPKTERCRVTVVIAMISVAGRSLLQCEDMYGQRACDSLMQGIVSGMRKGAASRFRPKRVNQNQLEADMASLIDQGALPPWLLVLHAALCP